MTSVITSSTEIAIFCTSSSFESLFKIMDDLCPEGWRQDGSIAIIELPAGTARNSNILTQNISQKLAARAADSCPVDIVIFGRIAPLVSHALPNTNLVKSLHGLDSFRVQVKKILQVRKKDWKSSFSIVASERWNYGGPKTAMIDQWLAQFSKFGGEYKIIGECLLRSLYMWSNQEIVACLAQLVDTHGCPKTHFCTNGGGSSGYRIRADLEKVIQSRWPHACVTELKVGIEAASKDGERVLWLEDCSLTGRETINVIEALRNNIPSDRIARSMPLDDPTILSQIDLIVGFPYGTTLALENIIMFAGSFLPSLDRIKVKMVRKDEVLTSIGYDRLKENIFYHKTLRYTPLDVVQTLSPIIFQSSCLKNHKTKELAISFCREIGMQLFRQFLEGSGKKWDADKFNHCALGVGGLGLGVTFPHTIPKSTIPLFWANGSATFRGKTIDWIPLFPGVVW